jgi:hypothetical protein
MTTEYKVYKPTNSDTAKDDVRRRAVNGLRTKAGFLDALCDLPCG